MVDNYIKLLMQWNFIHNLTSFNSEKEIRENIEDSIYPISFMEFPKKVIDIGSGAGFPAIFLAMKLPNTHFFLIEPSGKKASFLNIAKLELGLKNITVINKKIENIESFEVDMISSRALAKVDRLLEISKNFIKDDTVLLFFKGSEVYDEIKNIKNYKIIEKDVRKYLILKGCDVY